MVFFAKKLRFQKNSEIFLLFMFQILKSKKMVETKPAANKILKVNKSKHQSLIFDLNLT
jgi:hypothetical protein